MAFNYNDKEFDMPSQSLSIDDDDQSYIQKPLPSFNSFQTDVSESWETQMHSLETNLSKKNLTDEDLQHMLENEEIPLHSTMINLDGNKITHHGVSVLAKVFKKNKVSCVFIRVISSSV